MNLPNFIIGGTNKAGTTSIFNYLNAHPKVCGSIIKETRFFQKDYIGELSQDKKTYSKYFKNCSNKCSVIMEATPSYLSRGRVVAEKIKIVLGDPKLLFILRNPIDRLFSYYNFQKSRFEIPLDLSFDDYVEISMEYETKNIPINTKFDIRHLKLLGFGKYSTFIREYDDIFHSKNILIAFQEEMTKDLNNFMINLCKYLEIDSEFYSTYKFIKSNATFFGKNRKLHSIALRYNIVFEPMFNKIPKLKFHLKKAYKKINESKKKRSFLSDSTKHILKEYYKPSVQELMQRDGIKLPESWIDCFA